MSNLLKKNIFSAAIQKIVQIVILLLLYRYLIAHLGIDQLGVWSVVMAAVSSARMSELGLGGSIVKYVAAYRSQEKNAAAAVSLQTAAISIAAIMTIITICIYPLVLWALPRILPADGLDAGRSIVPFGLASLWLTSLSGIWMSALDACLRSDLRASIMIVSSVFFFLLALIGVTYYGVVGLAAAQVVQGLILTVAGWSVLRRVMPGLPIIPKQWNIHYFKEMLSYGINFQLQSFVALLFEPATKILLGRFGGLSAAGYFEMAQQMVSKVRALVVESNRVIVPVYSGIDSTERDTSKLYVRNVKILWFIVTPLFTAIITLTPAICEVWVGSYVSQFVVMGMWITLAWFINTIASPAYFAYLGLGKLYWVTTAHVIMGGTNILGGVLFGYYFGWKGVLAAFVVALFWGSMIPLWAYQREYGIKCKQILSIFDAVSAGFCFIESAISIVIYKSMIDAFVLDTWQRVTIFSVVATIVSTATLWLHPFRRDIFSLFLSRYKQSME